MKLTPRQQQILDLIRESIDATGYPPTRVEIARRFGFKSPNAAEDHLRALAEKGAITLVPGTSRGIRLAPGQSGLPLVGRVAAGEPILAEQHIEDYLEVPASLFHPAADYLLRVRGDSMRDGGILDGDLLAVHGTPEARDGQLVVARIDDEVTVKIFKKTGNRTQIQLLPQNPAYEPIVVDLRKSAFAIEGLGVGVIRPRCQGA
ncbi:MAG: transcriptional repressor LexA [Porticoccaceae bacterium]|jgi:repressor LexA|nr:transcriptional repressor LexA [Porticoccaceae bacterium]MEA3299241.1 transcriptional repressor LexA [Pseudomonadota bacterium]HLS97594.1 transcriptional repressor LexA [Porticoccaceae bacterium]